MTYSSLAKLKDCPYCKSGLTETEKDFFPCTVTCTFQVLRQFLETSTHLKKRHA